MSSYSVQTIAEETFKKHVVENPRPVLVDFFADWCGPCKSLAPIVVELADAYRDRIDVYKLDVDKAHALARQLNIRAIPTLILFKNGQAAGSIVGAVSKSDLEEFILNHTA